MAASASLKLLLLGEDRSAGKALRGVGHEADTARGKIGKFAKFSAGALAGGLAAGGVAAVGLGRALYGMGKAAEEDRQGQRLLARSLQNAASATKDQIKATEDWITAQGKAFGVADDDLRPALATLARATGDVGKSQKLAGLAMEVSAGSGKDLGVVARDLAKASQGNTTALKKYQIETKNADGSTKTFAQAQAELTKKFSGQAKEGATGTKRMSVAWNEFKENIGAKVLPIIDKLSTWFLDKGLPAIQKFADYIAKKVGPVLADFGSWFKEKALPPLKEFAEKVGGKVKDLAGDVGKAFQDAKPYIKLLGEIFTNVVLPALSKAADVVFPALGLAIRAVGKTFSVMASVFTGVWNKVLAPVLRFFLGAIEKILGALGAMFSALAKVPKAPKWIKNTARSLEEAARKAGDLKDGINDLDGLNPKIKVGLDTRDARRGYNNLIRLMNLFGANAPYLGQIAPAVPGTKPKRASAVGSYRFSGGLTMVGESGPEIVSLPAKSRIYSATQSRALMANASGSQTTTPIVVNFNGVVGDRVKAAREIVGLLKDAGIATGNLVTV